MLAFFVISKEKRKTKPGSINRENGWTSKVIELKGENQGKLRKFVTLKKIQNYNKSNYFKTKNIGFLFLVKNKWV